MATRTAKNDPWPAQTPVATPSSNPQRPLRRNVRRRRIHEDEQLTTIGSKSGSTSKVARQIVADQGSVDQAADDCQFYSGNNVYSCFPTADSVIPQHQWTTFVWNSRRPEITQTNLVDIFLFHGDSRQMILHYPNVTNPSDQAGRITAQVNDSWWGTNGDAWDGTNTSYPFYWVIIRSDKTLDANAIAQATFTAVQTTYADSVVASMASSSLAASLSSASLASVNAASRTSTLTNEATAPSASVVSFGPTETGNVLPAKSDSSFPHWAIAVIVVLGFLAIAATCILTFLIIRRIRRRNSDRPDSNRNSMNSSSPMMTNIGNSPGSPLLPGRGPSSVGHGGPIAAGAAKDTHSVLLPDGASTISRAGSADAGPFSGQDAQIMADAFRKMLRKPDFADSLAEETDVPDIPKEEEIINRALAEEGRDIRSVSSSRGVRVETLNAEGPSDPPQERLR